MVPFQTIIVHYDDSVEFINILHLNWYTTSFILFLTRKGPLHGQCNILVIFLEEWPEFETIPDLLVNMAPPSPYDHRGTFA